MFPMIATLEEFIRAKKWLMHEAGWAKKRGYKAPKSIKVGAMIETPSIAWMAESLFQTADFISLGTNDLKQYFFAADRNNLKVSERYDHLHPVFLSFLRSIVITAIRHKKCISICGEMASNAIDAAVLLALGYRSLSVSSNAIGPIKQVILDLNLNELEKKVLDWIEQGKLDIRKRVTEYLKNFI